MQSWMDKRRQNGIRTSRHDRQQAKQSRKDVCEAEQQQIGGRLRRRHANTPRARGWLASAWELQQEVRGAYECTTPRERFQGRADFKR